ncbi:TetR/AcrR family transcriptional regulator [Eubacterium aggregans]|uniref:TetR/AcrR family transcriptional regulator n=1 Tax=Eubacterium aggregans TaxID=81409 RepID=UPI003F364236
MPSEEYKEENMRQVLVAAMRCFEEEGIYVTTLNKIAKKAGVTIRSVSRYYGTKDRLIAKALGYY